MNSKGRNPNRAICTGDQARAGLGEPTIQRQTILCAMSAWSTKYLKTFIKTARSDAWRNAAVWLLTQREGIERQLKTLKNTKQKRKHRSSIALRERPLATAGED